MTNNLYHLYLQGDVGPPGPVGPAVSVKYELLLNKSSPDQA